jgi:hypothetical protein
MIESISAITLATHNLARTLYNLSRVCGERP